MADYSVGARDELLESEASQALMFCTRKRCLVVDLVRFLSSCLRVFVFLNATKGNEILHRNEIFFPVSSLPLRGKYTKEKSSRLS